MTAQARTCLSDDELLNAFEDTTLPFAEWIHRAHLGVAYIYLLMPPEPVAIPIQTRLRLEYVLAKSFLVIVRGLGDVPHMRVEFLRI